MAAHRESILESAAKTMDPAAPGVNPVYRAGDRLHIWSFDLSIKEQVPIEANSGPDLRPQIASALNRLRMKGPQTSITTPLYQAMGEFGPTAGDVHLTFFSDSTDAIPSRGVESVLRLFNHHFKNTGRLRSVFLIQLGGKEAPVEIRDLIASLGGRTVAFEFWPGPGAAAPVTATSALRVTFSPNAILFSSPARPEIIRVIPVEFQVNPPQSGLVVGFELITTNLANGMSIVATPNRLATEGRQSITFLVKNPQPGHYAAKIRWTSPVEVEPPVVPVDLEVLPSAPERIGVQFFPENPEKVDLALGSEWRRIPNIGVSFLYADELADSRVVLEASRPAGLEVQILPSGDPARPIDAGQVVKLGDLGRLATFQVRASSPALAEKELGLLLSVTTEPGQNVRLEGIEHKTIPLRFLSLGGGAVQIDTPEINLGELAPGTRSHKGSLKVLVTGDPKGLKARVTTQGLGKISIHPAEFVLNAGEIPVELEFGGLEQAPPGELSGSLTLVPVTPMPGFLFPEKPIAVSGRIREPTPPAPATAPKSGLEIEITNPFVTGEPILIRAAMGSEASAASSTVIASVMPPAGSEAQEVVLMDSGSEDDADLKAGDGVYSGAYRQTGTLGRYRVTITAKTGQGVLQSTNRVVPIYFQVSDRRLSGQLSHRKGNDILEFTSRIVSGAPGPVAIQIDTEASQAPVSTFLSSKQLQPGENNVPLLLSLGSGAQAGRYEHPVRLVTETIEGQAARIPIVFEIKVLSNFQYFMRLVGISLALAVIVSLFVIAPWRRSRLLRATDAHFSSARTKQDVLDA